MALLWTYINQQAIKAISENNQNQFDEIAEETQVKDLQDLIGFEFYQDITQNPDTTANAKLLDGGTWTSGGQTLIFKGLKYVLAYLFYCRYSFDTRNFDTFSGFARKNFDDAQPLSEGAIKNQALQYRKIGMKYWAECEQFLRDNAADYPYYHGNDSRGGCWDWDKINCI